MRATSLVSSREVFCQILSLSGGGKNDKHYQYSKIPARAVGYQPDRAGAGIAGSVRGDPVHRSRQTGLVGSLDLSRHLLGRGAIQRAVEHPPQPGDDE